MQVTGTGISFAGVIGGTNDVGTLDIDSTSTYGAAVSAQTVTVAAGKTAQFDAAIAAATLNIDGGTIKTKLSFGMGVKDHAIPGNPIEYGSGSKVKRRVGHENLLRFTAIKFPQLYPKIPIFTH